MSGGAFLLTYLQRQILAERFRFGLLHFAAPSCRNLKSSYTKAIHFAFVSAHWKAQTTVNTQGGGREFAPSTRIQMSQRKKRHATACSYGSEFCPQQDTHNCIAIFSNRFTARKLCAPPFVLTMLLACSCSLSSLCNNAYIFIMLQFTHK